MRERQAGLLQPGTEITSQHGAPQTRDETARHYTPLRNARKLPGIYLIRGTDCVRDFSEAKRCIIAVQRRASRWHTLLNPLQPNDQKKIPFRIARDDELRSTLNRDESKPEKVSVEYLE